MMTQIRGTMNKSKVISRLFGRRPWLTDLGHDGTDRRALNTVRLDCARLSAITNDQEKRPQAHQPEPKE